MSCTRFEDEGMLADPGETLDPHIEHCEDCRERLRRHAWIVEMITSGATTHAAPPDWKRRTLMRVRAARRSRRRRTAASLVVGAAIAAVLLLALPRDHREDASGPALVIQIGSDGERRWRGELHIGDEIRARGLPAGAPHFELRMYRAARELMVRCPDAGPPACRESDRALLVWSIPSAGTFQLLFFVSPRPIAAPRGSLERDLAAATSAGAHVVDVRTLVVR